MIVTFDGVFSGIYADFVKASQNQAGRSQALHVEDADNVAWRLEPGQYLETRGDLVEATPELVSRAIAWSRG